MSELHKLSVTITDKGAAVEMYGGTGALLAGWSLLAKNLSDHLNIPVADLAANLPEAVDVVMKKMEAGTLIQDDVAAIRSSKEGHDALAE